MNREFEEAAAYVAAMSEAEWQAQAGNRLRQNLLTSKEVAARFGVTPRTVTNWCKAGLLSGAWKPTKRSSWLVPASALEGFAPPQVGRPGKEKGDESQRPHDEH